MEELIFDYGANHRLFQDPSKERPPKVPKIHGPQRFFQNADLPVRPIPYMADALELYPSSDEISDAEAEDPQILGISPSSLR
jgi:hypothetical protein